MFLGSSTHTLSQEGVEIFLQSNFHRKTQETDVSFKSCGLLFPEPMNKATRIYISSF